MIIRKNVKDMSPAERDAFIEAIVALKNEQVNLPNGSQIGRYDQHVAIHVGATLRQFNGSLMIVRYDGAHGGPGFLPWHRQFLLGFERDLQRVSKNPNLALPFWDWSDAGAATSIIFVDKFLGKYSQGGGTKELETAAFFKKTKGWPIDQRIPRGLSATSSKGSVPLKIASALQREFGPTSQLPTQKSIDTLLGQNTYKNFSRYLEMGRPTPRLPAHDDLHGWIGGMMGTHASPYDPAFVIVHTFIDRLWALWQALGHTGASFYDSAMNQDNGHGIGDVMWPWSKSEAFDTVEPVKSLLPDTPYPDVRPVDVLNTGKLNVCYVGWSRVKAILDGSVKAWSDAREGRKPRLDIKHGPFFDWSTRNNLLKAEGRAKRLIEPDKIGNGLGHQTNLVRALREGFPDEGVDRMPIGGPYLSLVEIAEIAHWIDMGCPDDQGKPISQKAGTSTAQ